MSARGAVAESATRASPTNDSGWDEAKRQLAYHCRLIWRLCAGYHGDGVLVLSSFGEKRNGDVLEPDVRRIRVRAVGEDGAGLETRLASAAARMAADRYRNVYLSLAIYRPGFAMGSRGSEDDIEVALGLVADFDDTDAAQWRERCPLEPQLVVETSEGRFQCSFFFDRPLKVAEAKPLAERLCEVTSCDTATKSLCQPWRLAGTLNWPSKKKVVAGRPKEPQVARVVVPWNGRERTPVELLRAKLAEAVPYHRHDAPPAPEERPAANGHDSHPDGLADLIARVPPHLLERVKAPPDPGDDRSAEFFSVALALLRHVDEAEAVELFEAHPNGPACHHLERRNGHKRLVRDVARAAAKLAERSEEPERRAAERGPRVESPPDTTAAEAPAGAPWPQPLGAALSGLAGDIVRALEPHTEADPAALLCQFLATFGAAAGRGPHFMVGGARHGTNLFAAIVGASGKGRKGTAAAEVRALFAQADPTFTTPDHIASGLSSGEGLLYAVRDPVLRTVRDKRTGLEEIETVDDGVANKRLLIQESELGGALRVMTRDGSTLSAMLRAAWDGTDLRSLVKNSPLRATGPHIAVVGHITVDELRRTLDATEMANGFSNRFLHCCARRSKVLPDPTEPDAATRNALVIRLHDALRAAREIGRMERDGGAARLWAEVYPTLSEGRPGMLGAATNRAEAQVLRLSVVYATLDGAATIGRAHLEAAADLWRYCDESARYVFGDALGDPLADGLMHELRVAGPDGLTRTQIRDLFARNRSGDAIDRALNQLMALGRVSREAVPTAGRPTTRWRATR